MFRAFLVKELHGWQHDTDLKRHLEETDGLVEALGFDVIPNQSTLCRTWNHQFSFCHERNGWRVLRDDALLSYLPDIRPRRTISDV